MKNKRNIYCEYQFWEAFFDMEEQVLRNRNKRRLWDAFYEFLAHNNLFFNVSLQSINPNSCGGKNLNEILHAKGGAGVKYIPHSFPKIEDFTDDEDDKLNSVFLTMFETSECRAQSKRFGVIVLNIPMIFSAKHIFEDNGVSFDYVRGQNWRYLCELKEKYPSISCCNSLVIVDRYFLNNITEENLSTNLRPIFEALLPQSLDNNITFTICIFSEIIYDLMEDKISMIEQLIEELRPRLKHRMNFYNPKWLHDRSIFTNNIMLTSGIGFNVFKANERPLKFTSTSLFFPFFLSTNNQNDIYLDWIQNILKEERCCQYYNHNYWGDRNKKHHLLDFYYEEPARTATTRPTSRWRGFNPREGDFTPRRVS